MEFTATIASLQLKGCFQPTRSIPASQLAEQLPRDSPCRVPGSASRSGGGQDGDQIGDRKSKNCCFFCSAKIWPSCPVAQLPADPLAPDVRIVWRVRRRP